MNTYVICQHRSQTTSAGPGPKESGRTGFPWTLRFGGWRPDRSGSTMALGVLTHGIWADRRSSTFGVQPAPIGLKPLQTGRPLCGPQVGRVFCPVRPVLFWVLPLPRNPGRSGFLLGVETNKLALGSDLWGAPSPFPLVGVLPLPKHRAGRLPPTRLPGVLRIDSGVNCCQSAVFFCSLARESDHALGRDLR
jgi:hypothetical protein